MDHKILKKALAEGCSVALAEMLACRQPPAAHTDEIPNLAAGDPLAGIPDGMRERYIQRAKAAGVNPTGKRYVTTLADSPGDPRAFVETKSDIHRVMDERQDDRPINPAPPVAEDIIEQHAMDALEEDGCQGTCTVREWQDAKEKIRSEVN